MVLNDSGAEYGYYATDVTRTYPVERPLLDRSSARSTRSCSRRRRRRSRRIRPGATHDEIEQASARVQTEALVKLGLLSGDVDKLVADRALLRSSRSTASRTGSASTCTTPGRYRVGRRVAALAPGMVLTVEPGIYIPANMPGVDPKWWNIGVRIEDTVAVTATGSDCLSCGAPKEIADVEKAVGKK